jgi:hypothetical protein
MKATLVVLLALCATACVDGRNPYARVKMAGGPEFRFSGGGATHVTPGSVMHTARKGGTLRYQDGALYVDDRRVPLPEDARVVGFDGANVYVDGRSIDSI